MKQPIKKYLWQEYNQLSVFYIFCFCCGILYRLSETSYHFGVIVIGLLLCPILAVKRIRIIHPICCLMIFFSVGYAVMSYRQQTLITPTLSDSLYQVDIQGTIDSISHTPEGQKIVLSQVSFLNQPSTMTPNHVKLFYHSSSPTLKPGTILIATTSLRPPLPPVVPQGYDERFHLYFDGIGGIGTIQKIINQTPQSSDFSKQLELKRQYISQNIKSHLPDEVAQIAIPLTIGDQSIVSNYIYDIFLKSGITHILSVSGFHLSLLVAFIFFFIRYLLALFPRLAEQVSTKKVAGVLALLCAIGYILISGMQVPAIRSFIMIALVLIAILFNRNAVSIRSWNIAVFLILIFRPELILNIGFQLSFMAVLILITLYHPLKQFICVKKNSSFLYKFINLILGFMIVDFLMTLAITPFIIYHFNQYTPYSLFGNVLTGTLLSFWIMPLLFLGLMTMPFHIESFFLKPAAIGLEYVIGICEKISHLPHSLIYVSSFSSVSLLWITIGLILICLMKTPLRWAGIAIILIGIGSAVQSEKPDLLIANQGQTIALWQNQELTFLSQNASDYLYQKWTAYYGQDRASTITKPKSVIVKGKKIAFHHDSCRTADICFWAEKTPLAQQALSLYQSGTMAVYIQQNQIQVRFTNGRTTLSFRDKIPAYQ